MNEKTIYETPECPRCAELRGRVVHMHVVLKGIRTMAYECPSCDYVIPLAPFPTVPA
jgi:hypothetical protein